VPLSSRQKICFLTPQNPNMNLQEIQTAVNAGQRVHFCEATYTVQKNVNGDEEEWNIVNADGDKMPLTWKDEKTLNGKPEDYFINPLDVYTADQLEKMFLNWVMNFISIASFAKSYSITENEATVAISAGSNIYYERSKLARRQKEGKPTDREVLLSELEHVVNRLEVLKESELTPFQRSFVAGLADHVKEVIKNVKP